MLDTLPRVHNAYVVSKLRKKHNFIIIALLNHITKLNKRVYNLNTYSANAI